MLCPDFSLLSHTNAAPHRPVPSPNINSRLTTVPGQYHTTLSSAYASQNITSTGPHVTSPARHYTDQDTASPALPGPVRGTTRPILKCTSRYPNVTWHYETLPEHHLTTPTLKSSLPHRYLTAEYSTGTFPSSRDVTVTRLYNT